MKNINTRILDGSKFVEDCYVAQTKAFAPGEYLFIKEMTGRNDIRRVLDVGTGDGTFIHGLAKQLPDVSFDAIDADSKLIARASEKHGRDNIIFRNILFDGHFPMEKYDLVHTRFAVEHMPDVKGFLAEAYKRLKEQGILLITEYYIDDLNSENETWKLFRQKEFEFYVRYGSHPRISTGLPLLLTGSGYKEIRSLFRHITPSIIGLEAFYNLVKTYAILYHNLEDQIFTEEITNRIIGYSDIAMKNHEVEDGLFVTHTTGRKG